jgi:hypothetical protein
MADTPPNIDEFNQIAALVFAQLYREFPVVVDINSGGVGCVGNGLGQPYAALGTKLQ